jgi:hypothetical protein
MHHDGRVVSRETWLCTDFYDVGWPDATHRAPRSCSVVDDVEPAGEIVRDLVRVAEAAHTDAEQLA